MQLTILTFNAALLDVRILNHSVYCPVDSVYTRTPMIARALLSLRPDIIFLQEIFHYKLQKLIHGLLDHEYPYVTGIITPGLKPKLGNELLILSRYPVADVKLVPFNNAPLEEKIFTCKGYYHSTVTIPELGNIELINFHTTAGGMNAHPEHDRMEGIRHSQISQLLSYAGTLDKVILAGDLNAGPQTSIRNYQQVLQAGFIDTFAEVRASGCSWDPENPLVAKGRESHLPAQRIDHIFISAALAESLQPAEARIVLTGSQLEPADTTRPLSDHYGVMTSLRAFA